VRASRLVALLLLLQSRGRMTAEALAAELEVSVRTIYRDLEALGQAGVPVYAERGPGGGCQLVDGYRTRLTGLTPHEADALFLSGVPGPIGQLGLGTVLAAAQLKVLAALPPELRRRAARVHQRFHLDAPSWFRVDDDVPCLVTLAEATWRDARVDVRYARADRVVRRVLDPLGLVLKAGVWYLVARSRGAVRTYRVSRVQTAVVRDEVFTRPDNFDLAAQWAAASQSFEESLLRYDVHARLSPEGVRRLPATLEPAAARAAAGTLGAPVDSGWRSVVITAESPDHAYGLMLAFGEHIDVVAPAELRNRMTHTAEVLARRYAPAAPARATG
jgi:predicted DNA-binding transcriptional regulator YafY